jgi:hypothetical protein
MGIVHCKHNIFGERKLNTIELNEQGLINVSARHVHEDESDNNGCGRTRLP